MPNPADLLDLTDVRPIRNVQKSQSLDEQLATGTGTDGYGGEVAVLGGHPMDSEAMHTELRRVLNWYYLERERQAANRLDMAMDADFYDGLQWDPEDAAILAERGQMPLVYNEVAPMCDWIIGTERRARVDWSVLPRTEDDVQVADVKTKVLKYVSDINRVVFNRSRAFADAVKSGVGWVDDGVRDDPTKDILYSKWEDWRNVLWDSTGSYDLDLDDARYIFRWRWVDIDLAIMMFPDRENQLRQACEDSAYNWNEAPEEAAWVESVDQNTNNRTGHLYAQGAGMIVDAKRQRVKLIECQYRKPARVTMVADGTFKGSVMNKGDQVLGQAVANSGSGLIDKIMMRTHFAVFTEAHMLSCGPSIYRHNKFSLTPIWCYRRGRDRLPYGVIRRVRDIQQDLNKRASKALFLLNTNQVIMEKDAVEDIEEARDEVNRPDGMIVKKTGKEFTIRRDTDAATGQLQMMAMDAQSIQKSAGVNDDNMGRKTNAVSGEAIRARQQQGSVTTTEPFDNLRFGTQCQGEKQLSLTEQFYTDAKVIRLTGTKGALEWLKVNQPEQQPDGSIRYLNDITASQADFQVSEQDYAGSLRQVMFDAMQGMAQRLPPDVALRMMTIAMEFSDLPNKDEIAQEFRKLTGDRDPSKEPTPEEQHQMDQQAQMQAEAMQVQRQMAMTALEEAQAKVREINARADKLLAEAQAPGASAGGDQQGQVAQAVAQVQSAAAQQIDDLSGQLADSQRQLLAAQRDLANRTLEINKKADMATETARIEAASREKVAEIQAGSDTKLAALSDRLKVLEGSAQDVQSKKSTSSKGA